MQTSTLNAHVFENERSIWQKTLGLLAVLHKKQGAVAKVAETEIITAPKPVANPGARMVVRVRSVSMADNSQQLGTIQHN